MIPAVRLPACSKVRPAVDLKLKPYWQFDTRQRVFQSGFGERFVPHGELPKNSKIVYKVPSLAKADEAKLSKYEKDLRRYMQVILPAGESPAKYLNVIRAWPSVAEAYLAPQVSLPLQAKALKQ